MTATVAEPQSLPQFATGRGPSLDSLRAKIRLRPDLQRMLIKVGHIRAIPAERLGEFEAAVKNKPQAVAAS